MKVTLHTTQSHITRYARLNKHKPYTYLFYIIELYIPPKIFGTTYYISLSLAKYLNSALWVTHKIHVSLKYCNSACFILIFLSIYIN